MKTGIIGYGKMGRAIFSLLSETPSRVTLFVRDPVKAEQERQRLEKRLRRLVRSGMLSESDFDEKRKDLVFSSRLDDLHDCDLIIESITEDFEQKTKLLCRTEQVVPPEALITTNTSSLSITDLGAALERPERFCGLHFFHPVQLTTVVEIIRSDKTSEAAVSTLQDVCHEIRRRPLVVRDLPGSCVNLPLSFQICESLYILEQGLALPSRIDAIADTMVRVGPCISADIVGLPLVIAATERSLRFIPTSFSIPDLARKLLDDGRPGKAANRGIYLYQEDRPVDDRPGYYRNPGQTHSQGGGSGDDALRERIIAAVYYSVLLMAQLKLGSLDDLCAGVADVIGLKLDPLARMRELGNQGMCDIFERLAQDLGPRYDCEPIAGILSSLDEPRPSVA
jgi:3-hydroxybutyryl-CoA dehydrogenase